MITAKSDLKRIIKIEKKLYFENGKKMLITILVQDKDWCLFRFQRYLRYSEYYYNNKGKTIFHKFSYAYYRRKKNLLGLKLGIEMWENVFDEGLRIWHAGDIVVNGYTKIGKNCQLRGNNCIGNNGHSLDAPTIGNDVIFGNGAKAIGNITIADKVEIGAGAIVLKSCTIPGDTLVGIPAKGIKNKRGSS